MRSYVIRRLLFMIPMLVLLSFVTFLAMQLAPGDMLSPMRNNPQYSKETIQKYEKLYHLDKPLLTRYVYWLVNVCRGDFGLSFSNGGAPVLDVIKGRALNTVILSVSAIVCTWIIVIPLGIFAARHQNKVLDKLISLFSFIGMSTPGFFAALILVYIAAVTGILPPANMISPDHDSLSLLGKALDIFRHMLIPLVVLVFGALGSLQRIMRSNMVETLRAQFITTARAKGLTDFSVVYRHALRNAMNPMITIFGYQLSGVLSGAALVEIVCSWPGLGNLMLSAVMAQDWYLVLGGFLFSGVLLIVGNLIADILLALSDPRISYA